MRSVTDWRGRSVGSAAWVTQRAGALLAAVALLVVGSSWIAAPAARAAVTPVSSAFFDSQTGDYIGGGLAYTFPTVTYGGLRGGYPTFSVSNGNGDNFQVWLAGVAGTGPLVPGTYEDAQRFDFRAAGVPGLDVFGDGRGCNTVAGRFVVYDATYDSAGNVLSFAAAFEDHCEGGAAALFGALAYNSPQYRTEQVTGALSLASPNGTPVSQNLTITNNGPAGLTPSGFTLSGPNTGDFGVSASTCSGTLSAGVSCTVTVRYTPGSSPRSQATLTVFDENYPQGSPGEPAGAGMGHQIPVVGVNGAAGPGGLGVGPPTTKAFFDSEPGEWVGAGQQFLFPSVSAPGSIGGSIAFQLTDPAGDYFTVELATAGGPLVPGVYEEAQRAAFRAAGHPGLDIYGDGRGCNTVAGRFVVDDVGVNPATGNVTSFAARFEEHCEGGAAALFGFVEYNSTVAYPTPSSSPAALSFNSLDGSTVTQTLSITNHGPGGLTPSGFAISGTDGGDFAVNGTTCAGTMPSGQTCGVTVAYTPRPGITSQATLSFFDELAPPGTPGETAGAGTGRAVQLIGTRPPPPSPTNVSVSSEPNPSTYGQSVTFTATVSPVPSGGTVQFSIDGVNSGAPVAVMPSGLALFSTSSLGAGSHTIEAAYSGDQTDLASTSTGLHQSVNPVNTVTSLGSSANPSTYGHVLTLTAKVSSGAGTPSGSVTFIDGSAELGSAPLNAQGTATLSISSLAIGSHSLVATYTGDSNFESSSADLNQSVVAAPTNIQAAPALLQKSGTTFSATLSRADNGMGIPDQTVVFSVTARSGEEIPLCSGVSGANGVASCTALIPSGGRGARTYTATYNGSQEYNLSIAQGTMPKSGAGEPTRSPIAQLLSLL